MVLKLSRKLVAHSAANRPYRLKNQWGVPNWQVPARIQVAPDTDIGRQNAPKVRANTAVDIDFGRGAVGRTKMLFLAGDARRNSCRVPWVHVL